MITRLIERIRFAYFCTVHRRSLAAQQSWQRRHIAKLVRYEYKNVPLYRELLDSAGVDAGSVNSLEDVRRLPLMSKQTFADRMAEDCVDNSRLVESVWYVTSGTGGTPFRFLMSEHAISKKYAEFATLRFLWWRGYSIASLETLNLARIKIRGPNLEHRLFVPVEEILGSPRIGLKKLAQFEPDLINAYPSILLEMTRLLEKDPSLPKPAPTFIISFGEMLFPSLRAHLERAFGCEVYDRYGLEEIGVVGVECERHDGFHVNTESVYIEILDESGARLPDGAEGRIIATDLFNYGMPFIRYDTGDRGRLTSEPCACGLRSPRVFLKGRYSAYLDFPHRRIHHLEFDGAMDGFMNTVMQYQIAKRSNTNIVARLIAGPAYHEGVDERVRESLQKLVGPEVRVDVAVVAELPITPRGKSRIVIDESAH